MAERVEIVSNKLIKKYPSSLELEKANNYDIQCLIKSLGLRNRDQILINAAKYLNSTSNYNLESLMAIKGIGHYISGAFLVFFKGINIPIIDSNIQRIFNKYFKITSEKEIKKILKKVPNKNVKEFYYGFLDFGAIKKDFIPNTTMVPELGAILWLLNKAKIDPNEKNFNEKLYQWYWPTVLSEEYSGSSDSVMGKDFRDWSSFLKNGVDFDINSRVIEARKNLDLRNTKKSSARYNAILCLLALLGAKDFLRGQTVGSVDFSNQKINDHHIFPSKVKGLDPEKNKLFNAHKNSILNRTLILDETNQKIQNKKPSIYVAELKKLLGNENTLKKFMESHLINNFAFECMKTDDFDNFIKEREKTITEYVNKVLS